MNGLQIFRVLAQKNNCSDDIEKNLKCDYCGIEREKKDLSGLHRFYYQYSLSCVGDKREIRFCNDSGSCLMKAYVKSLQTNDRI